MSLSVCLSVCLFVCLSVCLSVLVSYCKQFPGLYRHTIIFNLRCAPPLLGQSDCLLDFCTIRLPPGPDHAAARVQGGLEEGDQEGLPTPPHGYSSNEHVSRLPTIQGSLEPDYNSSLY